MNTSEFFLIYIPSKYTIRAEDGRHRTYKIKELDMNCLKTKSEVECAEERDDLHMELSYGGNIESEKENGGKLSDKLNEKYNRPIVMKSKTNETEIKDIFRQINRLKFCVSNVQIKIAIGYGEYLAVVKRDNTSAFYLIKNYSVSDNMRRLLPIVDLENFYQKNVNIQNDIVFVRDGIHRVLNKNQVENISLISKLLAGKRDYEKFLLSIRSKMANFQVYLNKFGKILLASNDKEKVLVSKLKGLKNREQTTGIQGVHLDMTTLHQISSLETELKNILDVKQETMRHIEELNVRHNDFLLFVDKILYDNAIMTDSILRNFEIVQKYIN